MDLILSNSECGYFFNYAENGDKNCGCPPVDSACQLGDMGENPLTNVYGIDTLLVTIGNSNKVEKSVDIGLSGYTCPSQVDASNWYSTDTYSDTFAVTVSGSIVTARKVTNWGLNLQFYCRRLSPAPAPTAVPSAAPTPGMPIFLLTVPPCILRFLPFDLDILPSYPCLISFHHILPWHPSLTSFLDILPSYIFFLNFLP